MGVGQDATSSPAIYQYLRKGVPTGPAPPALDGAAHSCVAKGHPGYVEPASHAAGSSGVPRPGQGYYAAAPAEQAPGPAALGGQPPLPPGPKPVKAKAPPRCALRGRRGRCALRGCHGGCAWRGRRGLAPSGGAAACAAAGAAAALPAAVGAAPAPPAAKKDYARVKLKH